MPNGRAASFGATQAHLTRKKLSMKEHQKSSAKDTELQTDMAAARQLDAISTWNGDAALRYGDTVMLECHVVEGTHQGSAVIFSEGKTDRRCLAQVNLSHKIRISGGGGCIYVCINVYSPDRQGHKAEARKKGKACKKRDLKSKPKLRLSGTPRRCQQAA